MPEPPAATDAPVGGRQRAPRLDAQRPHRAAGATARRATSYQWQRLSGGSWEEIDSATGATYVPNSEDLGRRLRVAVVATNEDGSASAASNPTAPIGAAGVNRAASKTSSKGKKKAGRQGQGVQEEEGLQEEVLEGQEEGQGQEEGFQAPVGHNAGMAESLRGKLILASPVLKDPNFIRTVVLIAEHTDEGAMGLVLNRPANSTVGEAVPDLSWLAGDEEPVYVGGPVAETAVIVLAEFDRPELAGALVEDDLGFIGADADDPERLDGAIRRARVFAGHAGWGPGQLEDELAEEAWIIEPPQREEIFTVDARRAVGHGAQAQGPPLRAAGDDAARSLTQLSGTARPRGRG